MAEENANPAKTPVFSAKTLWIIGALLAAALVWKITLPEAAYNCPGGHADLKGRGMILESVVDGQVMRVTLQKQDGQSETVTIDLCSGRIIGALTLETDAATLED